MVDQRELEVSHLGSLFSPLAFETIPLLLTAVAENLLAQLAAGAHEQTGR
jgi:hypothetical protein